MVKIYQASSTKNEIGRLRCEAMLLAEPPCLNPVPRHAANIRRSMGQACRITAGASHREMASANIPHLDTIWALLKDASGIFPTDGYDIAAALIWHRLRLLLLKWDSFFATLLIDSKTLSQSMTLELSNRRLCRTSEMLLETWKTSWANDGLCGTCAAFNLSLQDSKDTRRLWKFYAMEHHICHGFG